jgi:hypothetical protein
VNCNTVTMASCPGEIPDLPRTPKADASSASPYSSPSSSRIRIASVPFGNAALAILAVSSGTCGNRRGRIDTTHPRFTAGNKEKRPQKDHPPKTINDWDPTRRVTELTNRIRAGEVYAPVRANGDAAFVEGGTAVEEHRVRHRGVVELAAAVVEILPGHVEGSGAVGALALPVATGTGP